MPHRLSEKASEDIENLFDQGIDRFGVLHALNYLERIRNLFALLDQNPRMGRERTDIFPAVRTQPVGSHIIVYEEDDEGSIFIIRIRHHREDWLDDPIGLD